MPLGIYFNKILQNPKSNKENGHNENIHHDSIDTDVPSFDLATFEYSLQIDYFIRALDDCVKEEAILTTINHVLKSLLILNIR
jgi:hypothetical protein